MFDAALYRQLAARPGNLFCSPYSIAAALAMLEAGAGGATRTELQTVLGSPDPVDKYGALGRELKKRSQPTPVQLNHLKYMEGATPDIFGCHLSVANALWCQNGYPVNPDFVAALQPKLDAELDEVVFKGAPADPVAPLNSWV